MLVVALTSWIKRINSVKRVVESIMNNTVQPDKVYLNLSSTEFEEIDLPQDLVDYFNTDERLIINWVDGENTKTMKKVFPILKYLNDDDIIIDGDDDILFPKDLIESRLKDFNNNGGKYPITSNTHTSVGFNGQMKVMQAMSLYQKRMLKNYETILTDKIIKTYNDDRTYLHLCWMNGYKNKPCSKYNIFDLLASNYNLRLDFGSNTNPDKKLAVTGRSYDDIFLKEFKSIFGQDKQETFGCLKEYIPDLVQIESMTINPQIVSQKETVAIIAISRLENDYINEWIEHHFNIGVDHIYIYDNSSLKEEKLSGAIYEKFLDKVSVIPAYNKQQYQKPAYKDAYQRFGNLYEWLIYIDIDEFIMLQKDNNIKDFINRFPKDLETYRMHWQIFGDDDLIDRNRLSSIVNDITTPLKSRYNIQTKSIIKGGLKNIDFISVHYAVKNVNGKISHLKTYYGNMIHLPIVYKSSTNNIDVKPTDYTYVKLNHYMTKTICEYICQKMRRPDAARNYTRTIDNKFYNISTKTDEKNQIYELSKRELKYFYFSPKSFENAGDYFNNILMNKLYFCKCVPDVTPELVLCGSVLGSSKIKDAKYILGCGFQNSKQATNTNSNAYLAIRGKLTKERLINQGIKVNENIKLVDPGLMVSRIYDLGEITKKYKIGIIPHYVDEDELKKKYGKIEGYKIISMKTSDVLSICRQIQECEMIVSSSLHGIIFSHSLGVPVYHIECNKLQNGDNFKFKDYYSSYDDIHYERFVCEKFQIPFEQIIEYDNIHRLECNPSQEEIKQKQNDFISILPYKKLLRKDYQ